MNHKRILFITDMLYPYMSANSEIAYRLGKELRQHGFDISIMGRQRVYNQPEQENPYGLSTIEINIKRYPDFLEIGVPRLLKLLKIVISPNRWRFYLSLRKTNCKKRYFSIVYEKEIERELKKNKYDCIVAFVCPIEIPCGLISTGTNIPVILYKLDPWTTHCDYDINHYPVTEIQADDKARAIITTSLIIREYYEKVASQFKDKVVQAEFPNIVRYESHNEQFFEAEAIHCVFAGSIYKDIRNPYYTISMFQKLQEYPIIFHMIGVSDTDSGLPFNLPKNIICHGHVSSDEAMHYMQSADILVNIGNTVLNQIPSKILTYISLGKPILNFIKSEQCPTLPYMEQYPLALNILETSDVLENDVERMKSFILSSKGKRIPFEKIEKLYYRATPEFVGKQLYDVICNVTEDNLTNGRTEIQNNNNV